MRSYTSFVRFTPKHFSFQDIDVTDNMLQFPFVHCWDYSLDVEWPPKVSVLKVWSPKRCYHWKAVEPFERWGLGEVLTFLEVYPPKGLWDPAYFLFLFCCLGHDVNGFAPTCTPCHCNLPAPLSETESKGPAWSWSGTSKTVSQNKTFLS